MMAWLGVAGGAVSALLTHYFIVAPLDFVYFIVKSHFFGFPKMLGGNENQDPRYICSRILNLPTYDISDDLLSSVCSRKFDEIIKGRVNVVLAVVGGLLIHSTFQFIWKLFIRRLFKERMNQSQQQIQAGGSKRNPRSPSAIRQGKDTEVIHKECVELVRTICNVMEFPNAPDDVRVEEIRKALGKTNPLVKTRVKSELIGSIVSSIKND